MAWSPRQGSVTDTSVLGREVRRLRGVVAMSLHRERSLQMRSWAPVTPVRSAIAVSGLLRKGVLCSKRCCGDRVLAQATGNWACAAQHSKQQTGDLP